MKSLSYLNTILTLLVLVLIGNLWMGYHGVGIGQNAGLSMAQEAEAGKKYQTPDSVRVDILNELKKSNDGQDKLIRFLKSGDVQVRVVRDKKSKKR